MQSIAHLLFRLKRYIQLSHAITCKVNRYTTLITNRKISNRHKLKNPRKQCLIVTTSLYLIFLYLNYYFLQSSLLVIWKTMKFINSNRVNIIKCNRFLYLEKLKKTKKQQQYVFRAYIFTSKYYFSWTINKNVTYFAVFLYLPVKCIPFSSFKDKLKRYHPPVFGNAVIHPILYHCVKIKEVYSITDRL